MSLWLIPYFCSSPIIVHNIGTDKKTRSFDIRGTKHEGRDCDNLRVFVIELFETLLYNVIGVRFVRSKFGGINLWR